MPFADFLAHIIFCIEPNQKLLGFQKTYYGINVDFPQTKRRFDFGFLFRRSEVTANKSVDCFSNPDGLSLAITTLESISFHKNFYQHCSCFETFTKAFMSFFALVVKQCCTLKISQKFLRYYIIKWIV